MKYYYCVDKSGSDWVCSAYDNKPPFRDGDMWNGTGQECDWQSVFEFIGDENFSKTRLPHITWEDEPIEIETIYTIRPVGVKSELYSKIQELMDDKKSRAGLPVLNAISDDNAKYCSGYADACSEILDLLDKEELRI